jgi:cyclomaltodextrinase
MSVVPVWVTDAIFYQIFPERFENGDSGNDPHGVHPWGDVPKPGNYFGGDLRGIIDRFDHLKNLGINALYLNPIFAAESNHKYNTSDYLTIDPAFGTNELFDTFLALCHRNNIRVVLDGVFNHVGTAHFAFQDVKKNGNASPYASWFNIYSFPVHDARHPNYECWWGHGSLPKLMVEHPDVKKYLFDVTRYWTEKGIDGWRLDVPNEIPHAFWKEWRTLVRQINPDCYIVGELWQDASSWLQGDEFDATMNYRFRQACIDYFAHDKISSIGFARLLQEIRDSYPMESNFAMQNLLGSHDTERYLTLCNGEEWRMMLSVIFQMTYLGAPMIYYGDEIGMEGNKDPDCRRCMIWDSAKWNTALYTLTKNLIRIRTESPALRRGEIEEIQNADEIQGDMVLFRRRHQSEIVYTVINKNSKKLSFSIPVDRSIRAATEALSGTKIPVKNGSLNVTVNGRSGMIFIMKQEI